MCAQLVRAHRFHRASGVVRNQALVTLLVFAATLGTSLAVAPEGRAQEVREPRSPTMAALKARTEAAPTDSLDTDPFWRVVAARATPLVEALPGTDSVLVTFLWRGDPGTRNALIFGDLTGWLPPANETARLPATDVWYLSVASRPDVRFRYRIAENDSRRIYWEDPDFRERLQAFRSDPLNPDTVLLAPGQPGSWFEGPAFRPDQWTPPRQPRGGSRDTLVLGDHRVVLYEPSGVERGDVGVIVALDGGAYDALVSTPATAERLMEERTIPPAVLVLVLHRDRNVELPPNEPFVRFVADTLFPALEARYEVAADPSRSVVVGSSLGGLAALYLGVRLPQRFGSVVGQSGAYWWSPPGDQDGPWLSRLLASREDPALRVYLDAGTLETQPVRGGASMLRVTQQIRDLLCARGDDVAYRTFPAGHMYEGWRSTLPGALAWALADVSGGEAGLRDCDDLLSGKSPDPRQGGS